MNSFCLILRCLQKQLANHEMNCDPRWKTSITSDLSRKHTYLKNSLECSYISGSSVQRIRCLILVNLSSTTRIVLYPFDQVSPITNYIKMSTQRCWGIRQGLRALNRLFCTVQVLLQVCQFHTNLTTSGCIPFQ